MTMQKKKSEQKMLYLYVHADTYTNTVLTVELGIILQFLEVNLLPHTEIIEKLLIWEITYTVLNPFLTN